MPKANGLRQPALRRGSMGHGVVGRPGEPFSQIAVYVE